MRSIGALTAVGLALVPASTSALVPVSGEIILGVGAYAGFPGTFDNDTAAWQGVPETLSGSASAVLDLETGERVFADSTTTAVWSSVSEGSVANQASFGASGITTDDAQTIAGHFMRYSLFAEQDGTVTFNWDVQLNGDPYPAGLGFFAEFGFGECRASPVFVSPFGEVGNLSGSLTCDFQGGRLYDLLAYWELDVLTDVGSGFSEFTSGYNAALTWSIDEDVVPPPPPPPPVPEVPEPASWALMITGFGLAGGALRRRRLRLGSVLLATA